jgi:SpoIID/LytB domain protein
MKKIVAMFCCVVFLFYLINAPFVEAGTSETLIRVKLASMGEVKQVSIELAGGYQIKEDDEIQLKDGQYDISYTSTGIEIINFDGLVSEYKKITLIPTTDESLVWIENPTYGLCAYLGYISFTSIDTGLEIINTINIEPYLCGVLPTMMGNEWAAEALKAQAVVARTYAMCQVQPLNKYDTTDTVEQQAYIGYRGQETNIINAINETRGQTLKYGSKYVEAYSTLSNGGVIESSQDAWQHYLPYSVVKKDEYDTKHKDNQFANWTKIIKKTEIDSYLEQRIISQCQEELKNNGYEISQYNTTIQEIKAIELIKQTISHRVKQVNTTVVMKMVDTEKKEYMLEVCFSLDDEAFKQVFNVVSERVSVDETLDSFILYGGGYGHGVGLSRYGTDQMAQEGESYDAILSYYFPNTYLDQRTQQKSEQVVPQINTDRASNNPFELIIDKEEPLFGYGTITGNQEIDIKQGPGVQYETISSAVNKLKVAVFEVNGEWLRVNAGDETGYIQSEFVNMDEPIETQQKMPNKQAVIEVTITTEALPPEDDKRTQLAKIVRNNSGPTTNNHQAGMGQLIWLIEEVDQQENLADQTTEELLAKEKTEIHKIQKTTVSVCANLLNIRSDASVESAIIGQVRGNTRLIAIAEKGNWLAIQHNTGMAFVDKSYVEKVIASFNTWEIYGKESAVIASNNTNFRQQPNTVAAIINQLQKGTMVEVVSEENLWCFVKVENTKGYIHNAYLIFENQKYEKNDENKKI